MSSSGSRLPAVVLGALSVAVVIGGTAVAVPRAHATKVDGGDIKKHSIAGNRLEPNTITGKQIKESALGRVPAASHADSAAQAANAANAANAAHAAQAGNAAKLGGAPPSSYLTSDRFFHFSFTMSSGDSDATIGTYGPLTFYAECGDDAGKTDATIAATTTTEGMVLSAPAGYYDPVPTDSLVVLADADSLSEASDTEHPWGWTQDGTFSLGGGGGITALVHSGVGDCAFAGDLMNVAQ